jgi:hypothetical protein
MQIALQTLLILLGFLPGVAFLSAYYSGMFPRRLASLSPLGEMVLYVAWALPIDAVALRALSHPCGPIPLAAIMFAFRGDPSVPSPSPLAVLEGYGWWKAFVAYSAIILCAALAGLLARRIVWSCRLDLKWPLLRVTHEWFYLLQGRVPGLPWRVVPQADVLVSHPGEEGTRLYSGVLSAFEVDKDGEIENLVLVAAKRHKGRGQQTTIVPIPGQRFIIMGSSIHSINMRYYQPNRPAHFWRRQWYRLEGRLRSFLFEEP